jgi:hypothetical protein
VPEEEESERVLPRVRPPIVTDEMSVMSIVDAAVTAKLFGNVRAVSPPPPTAQSTDPQVDNDGRFINPPPAFTGTSKGLRP